MTALISAAWGLEDGPEPGYDNRTAMDLARTPHLNRLAGSASAGQARFVVAGRRDPLRLALSIAGYDPASLAGGVAPFEAMGCGAVLRPHQVVFRMDLVTLEAGSLVSASPGDLQEGEAQALFGMLKARVEDDKVKLYPAEGGRAFLVVDDVLLSDELVGLELPEPGRSIGQVYPSVAGRSAAAALIEKVRSAAAEGLESHEINRVRIDLGENPCNGVWIWAQGRSADLPSLRSKGSSKPLFIGGGPVHRGLAKALGADWAETLDGKHEGYDLLFAMTVFEGPAGDLKERIRRIEEWDAVTGSLAEGSDGSRALAACTLETTGRRRALAPDRWMYLDGRCGGSSSVSAADALAAATAPGRPVADGHGIWAGNADRRSD
ncbi:MAG: hypothetical protein MOGMAGMI_01027 [Candidatus Omnitrophica bacterium]|nr:hypothetical protein [Candidatus Omnitrophota bacterium]